MSAILPLRIRVEFPDGNPPFPAIVIAPGRNYPLSAPLFEHLTSRLLADGIAVFRFDWPYFSRDPDKGQPSEGLGEEIAAMRAVVETASADPKVDPNKLFVAGKSLGSIVAWAVFGQFRLRAGIFLTPVLNFTDEGKITPSADKHYPHGDEALRPTLFIAGNKDPLCAKDELYRFAAGLSGEARVAVIGGGHSLKPPKASGEDGNSERNLALAAQICAGFIADQLLSG
ncbi:alpha/beta fold hydrolase [Niveibacterium terrae]|uniref:alpha/beta fold hydrolase n=1 Tax=Niveibacterium terrae TaxID=3373598 RepID=UPI003A9369F4